MPMMMAAMAVICLCHGGSLRAAQHALLFQLAYLTGGKQIRDLAQVDLCWHIIVEWGERKVALAVVASRRRPCAASSSVTHRSNVTPYGQPTVTR